MTACTAFTLDPQRSAVSPPEARNLARDEVRLLAADDRRPLRHRRFTDLPELLEPGDLLVVNISDTEPAALRGHRPDGRSAWVHVSGPLRGGGPETFVVELRTPEGARVRDATAGDTVTLPDGPAVTLLAAHPDPGPAAASRLWQARVPGGLHRVRAIGRPIRYSYLHGEWPLAAYRTVFARAEPEFGSAEMPSAGRPVTPAVLAGLRQRGVRVAEVVLHTGVSSLEIGERPIAERYRVPVATALAVNATRAAGRRVVAVGTTVTRALETVADPTGRVAPGAGWTDLVLGPDRPARTVRGLVTGWHEPQASHLLLLEAVAGTRLVGQAYAAALEGDYLWHEFGDSCLLLP